LSMCYDWNSWKTHEKSMGLRWWSLRDFAQCGVLCTALPWDRFRLPWEQHVESSLFRSSCFDLCGARYNVYVDGENRGTKAKIEFERSAFQIRSSESSQFGISRKLQAELFQVFALLLLLFLHRLYELLRWML